MSAIPIMLIVYLVVLSFTNANCERVKMVTDVLQSIGKPAGIKLNLCWPPENIFRLVKQTTLTTVVAKTTEDILFYSDSDGDDYTLSLLDSTCFRAEVLNVTRPKAPLRWMVLHNQLDSIPDFLFNLDILPHDDVIIAVEVNDTYELSQVYRASPKSTWIFEHYGTWTRNETFRLHTAALEPLSVKRRDLKGTAMQISYVVTDNSTLNHLGDYLEDQIDTITKTSFPLTNHLLDYVNASRVYKFTASEGRRGLNGSWTGMLGDLVHGEAIIGGTPVFFSADRISIVDFIARPTSTLSKFVFRQPKLSYVHNLFSLPFKNNVWISIAALVVFTLFSLLLVTSWEWQHYNYHDSERSGVLRPRFLDVAIFTIGAVLQQGSNVELKGKLGRIVILVPFLSFMFLYTSYSANIVALLQSSSTQIKTLEDLLHSRLKFGVDDTAFNRYHFPATSEPVKKALYETKIAPPGVPPNYMAMERGVKNMQEGLFAFHMVTGIGYKFVGKLFQESEKCGLEEIQFLQVIDPWLVIKKNSPYKEMLKVGMLRIQEFGLQYRENSVFYAKKPRCSGQGSSFVSVSMVDCYPVLLLFVYGVIVSIVLLLIERLNAKRKHLISKFCDKNYIRNV